MPDLDLVRLREHAETQVGKHWPEEACDIPTLIALLDELERLQRTVAELSMVITGGVPLYESQHLIPLDDAP